MNDHALSWRHARTLALVLTAVSLGCSADSSGGDGADTQTWPKRVTLRSTDKFTGEGVRLEDGSVSMDDGDLMLSSGMVISLGSPSDNPILCRKGTFTSLADVPVDASSCESMWVARVYVSADAPPVGGESAAKDVGLLVRDPTSAQLYRMRLLGDTVDEVEASVTFDYEPVP